MNDLKDYREKELKNYVIGNILIALLLTNMLEQVIGMEANTTFEACKALIGSAVISSVLSIYVFITNSILPGDTKFAICYLGITKMPGFTIFADAQENNWKHRKALDGRYTAEEVKAKYAQVYANLENEKDADKRKELQNTYWFKIYRKHQTEPAIYTANRDFLLCRDICIMTLWLLLAYLGTCMLSVLPFSHKLVKFFLIEFALTVLAVHGKGGRLARNVLAADIHPREEKESDSDT